MEKNKCWIDIHQVCGDCGRRILEKIEIKEEDKEWEKIILKTVKLYANKYNMACSLCSQSDA